MPRARGANILGEVIGYGLSGDAYHITSPPPGGEGAAQAIRNCLADGDIDPADVGYINAHGTSTPVGDVAETRAVKAVFGDQARDLIFGSTKSMTGHLLGGAGAFEFIGGAVGRHHAKVPPTINQFTADPDCDLNSAPNAMVERDVTVALSNSFGFGGHNVHACGHHGASGIATAPRACDGERGAAGGWVQPTSGCFVSGWGAGDLTLPRPAM